MKLIFFPLTEDPVLALGLLAFLFLLISLPLSFWYIWGDNKSSVVKVFITLSNLILTAQLILRWWLSGHFPISNLYESLCFLTWACTLTQLLVERSWNSPIISAFATPISLLTIAFASFALPVELQESSPLVPALRSSWLVMHVTVIMCSYSALIVGSLLSLAVLIVDSKESLQITSNSLGVGGYRKDFANEFYPNNNYSSLDTFKLTRLQRLDSLSYRTITVGFLLLTLGLISGAVWANEAWGTWWSWDPKETWAFISWLIYASYLHTRLSRGWQGRRPAIIAFIGLFIIIICYIGVNLLGVGLHSYGWFF